MSGHSWYHDVGWDQTYPFKTRQPHPREEGMTNCLINSVLLHSHLWVFADTIVGMHKLTRLNNANCRRSGLDVGGFSSIPTRWELNLSSIYHLGLSQCTWRTSPLSKFGFLPPPMQDQKFCSSCQSVMQCVYHWLCDHQSTFAWWMHKDCVWGELSGCELLDGVSYSIPCLSRRWASCNACSLNGPSTGRQYSCRMIK